MFPTFDSTEEYLSNWLLRRYTWIGEREVAMETLRDVLAGLEISSDTRLDSIERDFETLVVLGPRFIDFISPGKEVGQAHFLQGLSAADLPVVMRLMPDLALLTQEVLRAITQRVIRPEVAGINSAIATGLIAEAVELTTGPGWNPHADIAELDRGLEQLVPRVKALHLPRVAATEDEIDSLVEFIQDLPLRSRQRLVPVSNAALLRFGLRRLLVV